jgi:HSP20 family protein
MSSIRVMSRRTFPVINVGSTSEAIEVLALVIAGERKTKSPQDDEVSTYAQERFNGALKSAER